ncbi:hypothetical protein NUV25_18100 [Burkholderia pseudomultivorans]|uniref:hypothetical protein n=1 Tax=Burkholderia pseudomultivorans TaxID=1207504 RepID=UPI002874D6CE|nr:hypothetical protein [Burkholderia pseudomultivorans]MDS0859622.1 hypothetical protein [Burkholderia pseudomultivorans]
MLRRVVKDHSDIKQMTMMRNAISVCISQEGGIVRAWRRFSAGGRRLFYFPRGDCPRQLDTLSVSDKLPSDFRDLSFILISRYWAKRIGHSRTMIRQFRLLQAFIKRIVRTTGLSENTDLLNWTTSIRHYLPGGSTGIFPGRGERDSNTTRATARHACACAAARDDDVRRHRTSSITRHSTGHQRPPPGSAISISTGS